ncbi:MAG TPA: N-acetyltransferase, partial [Thermodesulfobacteriota bacterium]|nr:N-acetyltransferase [Thermodesulfobacteriota bacterium]
THDVKRVAELIVSAQGDGDSDPRSSRRMVIDLIKAGNNFLGHENIFVSCSGSEITGLAIGYKGRGKDELVTLLRLLASLRLSEFLSYLTLTARLLHGSFTPDIGDDEFYISALAVDETHRRQGIGSLLLSRSLESARSQSCRSVILEVEHGNEPAIRLYRKFGFRFTDRSAPESIGTHAPRSMIMELRLA